MNSPSTKVAIVSTRELKFAIFGMLGSLTCAVIAFMEPDTELSAMFWVAAVVICLVTIGRFAIRDKTETIQKQQPVKKGTVMKEAFQDALRGMFAYGLPFTIFCLLMEVSFLIISKLGINPVQNAFAFALMTGMVIHPFAIVFAFMKPDFGKSGIGKSFSLKAVFKQAYNIYWTDTNRIVYGVINIALMFFLVLILNDNFDGEGQQALIIMSLVGFPLIVIFSTAYSFAIRD